MREARVTRKSGIARKCCCILAAAVIIGGPGGVYADTQGQKLIKNLGVDITWYDFGKDCTSYNIQEAPGDELYMLNMGLASQQNSKTAFVNGKGEVVLAPDTYDGYMGSSSGGKTTLLMQKGDKYLYVDEKGITELDGQSYNRIDPFSDGYSVVTLKAGGHKGLIDHRGNLIYEDQQGLYQEIQLLEGQVILGIRKDGLCDLLTMEGKLIASGPYDPYNCVVRTDEIRISKDKKFGFLDRSGREIIPPTYDYAAPFSEGLAMVSQGDKWGYIDRTGQVVIPLAYDNIQSFSKGVALVAIQNKWGIIDKAGNILVPCEYDWISENEAGFFSGEKDKKAFVIDPSAQESGRQVVSKEQYTSYRQDTPDRIAVTKNINGMAVSGYLDGQEQMLTGFKDFELWYAGEGIYKGRRPGDYPPEATPPNDYGQRYALLDEQGNNLTGFKYENAGNYAQGFQVVYKYYYEGAGLVNKHGAEVLPTIFRDILLTKDGYAFVTIGDPNTGENSRVGCFKIPADFSQKAGQRPITVYVDGVELYFSTEPLIKNQRTMVPMRKIFETLGAEVKWENETKTVLATTEGWKLRVTVGSTKAYVNGVPVEMDAAPFIQDGTTMVPLRFVSENLEAQVTWDNAARRVVVNTVPGENGHNSEL